MHISLAQPTRRQSRGRTEDQNIQDQHNKPNNTTSTSVFPGVTMGRGCEGFLCHREREEGEVDEELSEHFWYRDGFNGISMYGCWRKMGIWGKES